MNTEQTKILVVKLGALGDFIQAMGPMAAIRKHHPEANITLLTTKPFEGFAKDCGYFDNIWLDNKPKWLDITQWVDFRKQINEAGFSRVYDLQNNDRTSFYFKLLNKKPEWVGVVKGASHRNNSPERTAGHAFDGHVQTLKLAGIDHVEIDDLSWISADVERFELKKPYVLMVPGSAPSRPEKRWPAAYFGRLAIRLEGDGFIPVILGTPDEKDATDVIAEFCPEAINLAGKTSLKDIVALGRDAEACVGNDTGPMHMIAPTGCPCLVLFSSHSNPQKHYPKGPVVQTLQENDLSDLSIERVEEKLNTFLSSASVASDE